MPTLSEDDSDESDGIWQQVPENTTNKRRLTKSPHMHVHKKINLSEEPSTSTANRFQLLKGDDNDDTNKDEEEKIPKPPPIFIPNVDNISIMVKAICKIISGSDFHYKSMRDNQVRLMIKTIDSYRKVVKYLESKNISFHTYQPKQERAYRVVIKGIHHSTPTVDIKAELLLLGHQVRDVLNIKSSVTKLPLPMFFVDVDPNPNNKEIYNIRHINNAIVTIEPPKKRDELVQCFRCQQFGHTKAYCHKPFKCVKCGCDHPTASCAKDINTPPKCVHCLQNHTASYKGCKIYQELIHKKRALFPRTQPRTQNFQTFSNDFPNLSSQNNNHPNNNNNNNNNTQNIPYSQAVRGGLNNNESHILSRLETMLDKLMNLMTVIITKLCK